MVCFIIKYFVYWLVLKKIFDMHRVFLLCAFFMFIMVETSSAKYILVNDEIINKKVSDKIESMGEELYKQTSVNIYLAVPKTLNKISIVIYEQNLSKTLKSPYILLTMAKNEQKVDIINSSSLNDKFDKDAVLSPFPWDGTILPLLAEKKENDKYNAAMLNGYADIVEQIANSYNVDLENAIGNTNRDILHYVKYAILIFFLFILIKSLLKKRKIKND